MDNSDKLPADIAAAIRQLESCAWIDGNVETEGTSQGRKIARLALTAAILSRLTTAEAARDEACQVGTISYTRAEIAEGKVRRLERDLAAALARVERLEKALRFYADGQNYRMNMPLDPNSSWFTGPDTARAALADNAAE